MANASWTAVESGGIKLPPLSFVGLTTSQVPSVAVFVPDFGPPMTRVRSTQGRRFQSTPVEITGAQLALFHTFFNNTLFGGTQPFDWIDFETGAAATMKFLAESDGVRVPKFEQIIGSPDPLLRRYRATLELEIV